MKAFFLLIAFAIMNGKSYSNEIIVTKNISENIRPLSDSTLIDIFKSFDKQIISSNNDVAISDYLIKKNQEIAIYLDKKYPGKGCLSLITNDVDFVTTALLFSLAEANDFKPTYEGRAAGMPGWLVCAGGVIGATFGVWGIIDEISAAVSGGASFSTAWGIIKKIVKRYAGWIGVGYALYSIATECL